MNKNRVYMGYLFVVVLVLLWMILCTSKIDAKKQEKEQIYTFSFNSNNTLNDCKVIFVDYDIHDNVCDYNEEEMDVHYTVIEGENTNAISYDNSDDDDNNDGINNNNNNNRFHIILNKQCRSVCEPDYLHIALPRSRNDYLISDELISIIHIGTFTCNLRTVIIPDINNVTMIHDDIDDYYKYNNYKTIMKSHEFMILCIIPYICIMSTTTFAIILETNLTIHDVKHHNCQQSKSNSIIKTTPMTMRKATKRKLQQKHQHHQLFPYKPFINIDEEDDFDFDFNLSADIITDVDSDVNNLATCEKLEMDKISAEQTGLEMHTKMTNDLKLKNCVLPKDETLDFDDQKWKQWINENVYSK